MPSRQERRKAERDAAKRASAQAGAAGASGAAAAVANLNVNPHGDWTTQTEDPTVLHDAVGTETVRQRAGAGDREAQYSLGYRLARAADGTAGSELSAGDRGPKEDVGLTLSHHSFLFKSSNCKASTRSPEVQNIQLRVP
jgi:hypothetical protein